MSTVNIVLMMVLSAIIGFAAGNVWGQAKMKAIFNDLLNKLTNGLKTAAGLMTKEEDKDHE